MSFEFGLETHHLPRRAYSLHGAADLWRGVPFVGNDAENDRRPT